MYNEGIKSKFFEKYTRSPQTKKLLLHVFEGISAIEEQYNKDFSVMSVQQAQEAFNCISGTKVNGASTILMILKGYVRWCHANGFPTTNAVYDLRIDMHDKLRESYVASPHHLWKALEAAFPHPETNEIEYIYRSFLWLGFMGLQVAEAIQVTANQLNFEEMRLTFPVGDKEKSFIIYPESARDLHKAAELTAFVEPHGQRSVQKLRAGGNEILRGKVSDHSLAEAVDSTFRPIISRAFKKALASYEHQGIPVPVELSLKLTFKHIYMSGLFYRTYERERIGIPPSFDEIVLEERRNAKESSYSRNYTQRKHLGMLIRNMEQDYNNWKSVFA